ncbi:hypothetical protein HPC49_08740 [Pyxidicoccus fallax]|uniref:Lipoprotein n=1 Tax=Pyxidicoccus fallax TaxID=394095 RepID=A0A848L9B4_9BACT|nr:hypothetical protein [Pyxidicoccus fallax]NMO13435.1 hypothetical protein [Pyxidicoccus fallax]NPC78331.1 hypothetical protein [Pyxidicoccus fallax]
MVPPRLRLVPRYLLSGALLFGAACAGPTNRLPQPPSAYAVQQEIGQRDVIQAGEEYARNNSFLLAEASEAIEIRPNYWRIRFGLADRPGRGIELEFDELARRITRAQEIEITPGALPAESAQGGSGVSVPNAGQGRVPIP